MNTNQSSPAPHANNTPYGPPPVPEGLVKPKDGPPPIPPELLFSGGHTSPPPGLAEPKFGPPPVPENLFATGGPIPIPQDLLKCSQPTPIPPTIPGTHNIVDNADPGMPVIPTTSPSDFADNADFVIEEDGDDEFPLDCLPEVLRHMVEEVSRSNLVPVSLPAACGLGIIASSLGASLEVHTGPDTTTRGNLFIMPVAASGVGKGRSLKSLAQPLRDFEEKLIQQWKSETWPGLEAQRSVREIEIKRLNTLIGSKKGNTDRNENIAEMTRLKAELLAVTEKLVAPCMITGDATKEALALKLSQGKNEAIASISGEARGCVDVLCGRYNKKTGESIFTEGYSGDPSTIHRKGSPPVNLKRPCLSVLWMIQPDKLKEMLQLESMTSSGLMARFLIVNTRAEPQLETEYRPPLNESVKLQWDDLIKGLATHFHEAATPVVLSTPQEIMKLFRDYRNEIVRRRRSGGDLADVNEYAARWAENAWRIALVLHAAVRGSQAGQCPLSSDTASNAIKLMRWFSKQQLQLLSAGREEKRMERLNRLIGLLSNEPDNTCTLRDLIRRYYFTKEEVQALASAYPNHICIKTVQPDGPGRPSVLVSLTTTP
jgi:uncharacterized protein DUF3987